MKPWRIGVCLFIGLSLFGQGPRQQRHWTEAEAQQWYAREAWLVGVNYIPSTASNELEMWQEGTFDPTTIDRELGLAEGLGMNTVRVFLHYMVWHQDPGGFERRINLYLMKKRSKALVAAYVERYGTGWKLAVEAVISTQPRPRSAMRGTNRRAMRTTASQLTRIWLSS